VTKPTGDAPPVTRSFVEASDVRGMREAVIALQRSKSLATAARTPAFSGRMEELRSFSAVGAGETRLEALALLFRIGAVAKSLRPKIEAIASEVLTSPGVPVQVIEDPDDRRYVGEALKFASGEWKRNYLARAVVEEVSGEEARAAFTVALVSASRSMADALQSLVEAFDGWVVGTQDVGASRVRRLVRVASALKSAIIELNPDPGDRFGSALLAFARAALGGESIGDREIQAQATGATLALLSTTVRFHFSLASDVETFAVVAFLHRWFQSRGWPTETGEERLTVARQIKEALVFLAKQGIGEDALRKTFLLVLNEEEAMSELRRLANDVPGIPSDLRTWLLTGRRQSVELATSDAVDETVLRAVDRDIAVLLRDSADLQAVLDRLEDDLAPAFKAYEPKLAPTADRLAAAARRIGHRIKELTARRYLRFVGRTGDVVEFNPVDHEPPADGIFGRMVRIKYPLIVRVAEGSPPATVLKAEVEGVE
jgi:hypothetical protein